MPAPVLYVTCSTSTRARAYRQNNNAQVIEILKSELFYIVLRACTMMLYWLVIDTDYRSDS